VLALGIGVEAAWSLAESWPVLLVGLGLAGFVALRGWYWSRRVERRRWRIAAAIWSGCRPAWGSRC
jgi:hypothetical protein